MRACAVMLLAVSAGAAQPPPDRAPIMLVVGCLSQASEGAWVLTDATEPTAVKGKPGSKDEQEPDESAALGKHRFRLIGTVEEFGASKHRGHKVRVKGLLIDATPDRRINLTSLKHLSPACK